MGKPRRNQIYDAVIHRMVQEGLEKKEAEFRAVHQQDTDEALLIYLRQQAQELKHTPWPREIVGWELIAERFGGWTEAVKRAKLPPMGTPDRLTKFKLYQDEVLLQKQQYRINRAEKKERSQQRLRKRQEQQAARENRQERRS